MRHLGVPFCSYVSPSPAAHAQDGLTREQRSPISPSSPVNTPRTTEPYEWKRDAQGFDLLRLTPWLHRIQHSDDLDFQEA